jgi:hypothetical protein
MTKQGDFYEILQVSPRAEPEVIEAAFRRLARKYHPDVDRAAGDLGRMIALNLAYETLKDPVRRADYDRRRGSSAPPSPRRPTTRARPVVRAWWEEGSPVSFGASPPKKAPDTMAPSPGNMALAVHVVGGVVTFALTVVGGAVRAAGNALLWGFVGLLVFSVLVWVALVFFTGVDGARQLAAFYLSLLTAP